MSDYFLNFGTGSVLSNPPGLIKNLSFTGLIVKLRKAGKRGSGEAGKFKEQQYSV
jgi:hypothetical protein